MDWLRVGIILVGYILAWVITNYLIKRLVIKNEMNLMISGVSKSTNVDFDVNQDGKINEEDKKQIHTGYIIGKCENLIIVTLVLNDAFTGLAIVFTAKNLVRKEKIEKNADFYLAGTMINFTATLIISFIVKSILEYFCL